VDRAGQHGHLAGRFAGADDADELGRPVGLGGAPEDAEAAGAEQVEGVGRIAFGEQGLAAGQGEPAGARVPAALEYAVQGVFQTVGAGGGHGERCW
jgi:hypothetical protein